MSELREDIRESLIFCAADEYYEMMQDPKLMAKFRTAARSIATNVAKLYEEDAEKEGFEMDEFEEILHDQMDELFSSDDKLKELAFQNAQNSYLTKEEALSYLEGYTDAEDLKKQLGVRRIKRIKQAHARLIEKCSEYYDFVDELLDRIVEISEDMSFLKATEVEVRNEQIRAILPNKEDYINLHHANWKALKEFNEELKEIISTDPEVLSLSSAIINAFQEAVDALTQDLLNAVVKNIYG